MLHWQTPSAQPIEPSHQPFQATLVGGAISPRRRYAPLFTDRVFPSLRIDPSSIAGARFDQHDERPTCFGVGESQICRM